MLVCLEEGGMGAVLPLPTPTPSTSITLLLPPSELSGVLSLVMTRLLMLVLKGGTHGLAGRDMEHQTPPATSHHTGVAWQQQFDPLVFNTTQHYHSQDALCTGYWVPPVQCLGMDILVRPILGPLRPEAAKVGRDTGGQQIHHPTTTDTLGTAIRQ